MFRTSVVVVIVTVIFVKEVVPWTIDLPEVRRFYFEKYSNHDKNENETKLNDNQTFFDNINGDSLHNTERKESDDIDYYRQYVRHLYATYKREQDHRKDNVYAQAYKHGAYMVRKVSQGVLEHGSAYLDGLRLSIERYIEVLQNCSRSNFTADFPPKLTEPLTMANFTSWRNFQELCQRATEASEHVRRLSDLALWATKKLQDVAYTAKYNEDASMEENELILRLAWYLDKLARLTGYEPNPEGYIPPQTERNSPPAVPIPNPLNITDAMKAAFLKCLKEQSDVPATERCAFPNSPSVEDQVNRWMGSALSEIIPSSQVSKRSSDDTSSTALEPEILEATATDNQGFLAPTLTDKKSVRKRSISDETNPLVKALKYYAKHKIWEYSNPKRQTEEGSIKETEYYDVNNNLHVKSVQKRSVHIDKHQIHVDPFVEKHKIQEHKLHEVPLLKEKIAHHVADKIKTVKTALKKLYTDKVLHAVKEHQHHHASHAHHAHHAHVTHFDHLYRRKRSIYTDYLDVIKPRVPADPQGDISYYVKNKEGTNRNPDLAQAALVRAAFVQAFQRPNIITVHRYGANYNPAIPAPFYAGIVRSIADV